MSKKLLVIKSSPALPITGADISMFERLELLQERHGWEARFFSTSAFSKLEGTARLLSELKIDAVKSHTQLDFVFRHIRSEIRFDEHGDGFTSKHHPAIGALFRQRIEQLAPTLLVANARDKAAVRFLSAYNAVPSIFFLTEVLPGPARATEEERDLVAMLKTSKAIIVPSIFMRTTLQYDWKLDAEVFLNAVNVDHYRVTKDIRPLYCTLVQPYRVKGLELFLRLVEASPNRSFISAGGFGAEFRATLPMLRAVRNLIVERFTTDLRPIYAQSRVVLVPSLCEEAFGRVVVEALASGTPVIASSAGALPEGRQAVCRFVQIGSQRDGRTLPLEPWLSALTELDSPSAYQEAAARAAQYADTFRGELMSEIARMDQLFLSLTA